MSFDLFMPSFFHQWFCHFQSFASLIKLIPKYFILFDVILNGILSLLSPLFSIRNAIDFSVFILYYFCLIHLLVLTDLCVCVCVCVHVCGVLRVFYYKITSSSKTPSFPVWVPFLSVAQLL